MKLDQGRIISERYEIIEKIGSGGMAIVYKAKDKKLDRYVTFKVMREEFTNDEEFIKRFDIEARSAAKLTHHNIVNVYDVGNEDSIYYIVMEYIDGLTLKEMITKKAPFDNDEILGIAIQIAEALKRAHSSKIVHRDIKPENILVTKKGVVKVTDFGIASAVSSATVSADSTVGSVYYFSPEQARGGFVDHKSDIYSLGITMYEMATNKLPFQGDSAVTIALKHIDEDMPGIKRYNNKISESIVKIIAKATEKKPINRYYDMDEFLDDLKRALIDSSGSFIKSSIKHNSETIKLSDDDLKTIRDSSRNGNNKYDKEEEKSNKPVIEVDNNYDEEPKETGGMTEQKITIIAIATSMIIVIIIAFFAIRYVGGLKQEPITLPDLTGVEYSVAKNQLAKYEIVILEEVRADDKVPEGVIISVDMFSRENGLIYEGDTIKLIVSSGKDKIKVINVIGKSEEIGREKLENIGLAVSIKAEYNDTTPKDVIIEQSPDAGEELSPGENVILFVSKGPEKIMFEVPDFTNMLQTEAEEKAQNLELKVAPSQKVADDNIEIGRVVTQSLEARSEAQKGESTITFYISSGPAELDDKPTTHNIEIDFPSREDDLANGDLEGNHVIRFEIIARKDGVSFKEYEDEIFVKDFPYIHEVKNTGTVVYSVKIFDEDGLIYTGADEPIDFDNIGD